MTFIKKINRSRQHKRHTLIQDELEKKQKWKRELEQCDVRSRISRDFINHKSRLLRLFEQKKSIKKISREVFYMYFHTQNVLYRIFKGQFRGIRSNISEFIGMDNYNGDQRLQRKLIDYCVKYPWEINTKILSIMEILIKSEINLDVTQATIWYKSYNTWKVPAWRTMRSYNIIDNLDWLLKINSFKLWSYYYSRSYKEAYDPQPSGWRLRTRYIDKVQKRLCSRLKKMIENAS